jgi:hypothetical protein
MRFGSDLLVLDGTGVRLFRQNPRSRKKKYTANFIMSEKS